MLPTMAIVRALPSAGTGPRLKYRWAAMTKHRSTTSLSPAGGRRFGTLLSSRCSAAVSSPPWARRLAGPVVLGAGASTPRAFSLWGAAKPKEPPAATKASEQAPENLNAPLGAVDPTPDAVVPATPPTEPSVPVPDVDLSSVADLISAKDILAMPERLGYLHAIGLDYGWGPTSMMQWVLEHVHVWTGLGWGASLILTVIAMRIVMVYPQIRAMRYNACVSKMRQDPLSKEALELMRQSMRENDSEIRQRGQALNRLLQKQYGVKHSHILWSILPIPFAFGLFRLVSGMTSVPVPSMETGGFLWFQDLTATDPYFILPLLGTGFMTAAFIVNAKNGPPAQQQLTKTFMYIFGVVGTIGSCFFSAAINLMSLCVGVATVTTSLALNNPRIRRLVDLPARDVSPPPPALVSSYEAPRSGATPPASDLQARLSDNIETAKKKLNEQVSTLTGMYAGSKEDRAEKNRRDLMRKLEQSRKDQQRLDFERKYKGGDQR